MRRRRSSRTGRALAASLALHAGVVAVLVFAPGDPRPPRETIIAVDIVSPPPHVAGEPRTEPPATQEPAPAPEPAPAEAPPPEPAAETPPPPEPERPKAEAPKEPAKAPEPRRTPPAQRPATPATPAQRPATPATTRPANAPGTSSAADRTRGEGTSTQPPRGRKPDPASAGGENVTVRTDGDPCPVQGYCERVTLTVQRFFRPPAGNAGARGEVCFRILRDGSVAEIETRGIRGGGAPFRLAMMEAAEAAGGRRAFGALPAAFDPQRWKWCVELSPR